MEATTYITKTTRASPPPQIPGGPHAVTMSHTLRPKETPRRATPSCSIERALQNDIAREDQTPLVLMEEPLHMAHRIDCQCTKTSALQPPMPHHASPHFAVRRRPPHMLVLAREARRGLTPDNQEGFGRLLTQRGLPPADVSTLAAWDSGPMSPCSTRAAGRQPDIVARLAGVQMFLDPNEVEGGFVRLPETQDRRRVCIGALRG